MTSDMKLRRVPWIALALSFLAAGVGHLYCGRIAKGLPLYFAWLLVPLGCVAAALGQPSSMGLVLLLMLPAIVVFVLYLYAALDAWRLAFLTESSYSLRDYNRASLYLLLIVVQFFFSIGLIVCVKGFVYEAFLIPSNSMSPTIVNGDRVLARKLLPLHYFPERGDMVVYRNPAPQGATRFVGRVVAVAGDEIEGKGEQLFINGKQLERDRVPDESLKLLGNQCDGHVAYEMNSGHRYLTTYATSPVEGGAKRDFKVTVPERHVFILGDNRDRSNDSRNFGSIHAGDILGHVDYIYWPAEAWSRFGVANDRLP